MIFFYIRPQDVTASTPQVPAETSINNGRFSIPRRKGPIPANYAIAISSTETPGRRPNPEVGPDKAAAPAKQLIPAKYNTQTELVVEIKQGIKELRIDIDSK